MKTVGVFEAKTRFSALIADAMRGKTTIVTKNGKPVAEIRPLSPDVVDEKRKAADRIRALRKRLKLSRIDWRELINEGREIW